MRRLLPTALLPTALILTALILLCPAFASAEQAADATVLEIAWLNGAHTDLDSDLAPIRRGPMLLDISSPQHLLTVHSNRLRLRPVAGAEPGTLDIDMEVDFEGAGQLVITLHTDAGKGATFEDQVSAPRQSVSVRGRAHFQPSPNGYVVTVLNAPATLALDIESRLAQQLLNSCTALAAFIGLDCGGLGEALSVATVPMPSAGTKYFIDGKRFTPEEKAVLDGLIR